MRFSKIFIALALLFMSSSAAQASDWVVYRSGQTKSTELWKGAKPMPGVNVPASAKVFAFSPTGNDTDLSHYKLENDAVVYDPPPAPQEPVPDPNLPDLDGFISAIWADENLQALRLQLVNFKPLLREYLNQPGGATFIQEAWSDLKASMPAPAVTLVESYAVTYHIPLVAAE